MKNMQVNYHFKHIVCFFLALLILLISCKKNTQNDNKNYESDVVYTDSFSPPDWEIPTSRRQVKSGDKDIGAFIQPDVLSPNFRNIFLILNKFMTLFKSQKKEEIKEILTLSAYNSYVLRYSDVSFDINYDMRIGIPEDINQSPLWINFKLIFPDKSLLGKIELTQNGDDYKISDFDEDFFNNLIRYINE